MAIRPAKPEEAQRLSEIACLSKAHWGYAAEQIDCWRTRFLRVTANYISAQFVWVAVDDHGVAIGFAALEQHDEGPVLEHLWVLPAHIGKGLGKRLFCHVAARVTEFNFTSDPHADDFYVKMGAQ